MICLSCGTENPVATKFCTQCAARLVVVCPSCGTANGPVAKFCGECATPLVPGATPLVPGASPASLRAHPAAATGDGRGPVEPVAERRLVSVLFADLVGFTTLAEGRDAEDTRELLTRYFDLARDVIGRYGGTVEKFIGDAVMAVWGAPTAREDDAERSVRAALELLDGVRSLDSGVNARAGVLTGEAAVTLGATNQGMVAGDLVNTASRLQSLAPPGAVLVGEATYRAASQSIAFEEVGEKTLKGKATPIRCWRAIRVVAERGGRGRSGSFEAPFVGYDEEFRQLKDLFHATARERRTRIVSITGIAGSGKSRLTWEFEKYLDGIVGRIWWHRGRSPAYGEGITFWPLGEMIRGRAGLAETDDEPTTRQRVGAIVREVVPSEGERRWVEPALLALLGLETGIPADQLFGAWRTFFERLSDSGPVVLVFEDLQWADSGTLDFIDHLLEWSRAIPLFIVTVARPELLDKRPDWGAGRRNFTGLYLEPLSEGAMRSLLSGLIPDLPATAVAAIVARAEGVPLYAVETVRMLVADGRLTVSAEGTYQPAGDLTSIEVPATLTALITARLDSLDPADRRLVLDAAVLGQSFTPAALAAVSGIAEGELEGHIRSLVRREVLTRETDPASPERGQYAFVHVLIREVAYNTLAKRDRKARHLAAARFFESLGTDELAGALAGHYLAARESAPEGAEADALAVQARLALGGAAERAVALGAHDQAVGFLRQALTVTDDPADEADILERAGASASLAAHHDQAEAFLRRALELRHRLGDRPAAAKAAAALGLALLRARRTGPAIELLEAAVVDFADLTTDASRVALDGLLARAYERNEQHRLAIEVADRALEAAEHGDLMRLFADALTTKASALGGMGRTREAIGALKTAEEVARAVDDSDVTMRALNNRAFYLGETDTRACLDIYAEGLALARRLGSRSDLFLFASNLGYTAVLTGDWELAGTTLEGAMAEGPDATEWTGLLNNLIVLRACQGQPVEGLLAESERLVAEETDPTVISSAVDSRAIATFASGRLAEARTAFRLEAELVSGNAIPSHYQAARASLWLREADEVIAGLAAIDATGVHGPVVETRRGTIRAGLAALEGRTPDALRSYREALAGWRAHAMPLDEALTGLDMVTLLDLDEPDVRAAADSSREILARLGARPFLERLERMLTRGTGVASG